METVVGVFVTPEDARRAAAELRRAGISARRINLLFPGSTEQEVHHVPTSQAEQPGIGKGVGGVVGAALGAAAGMEIGTAIATAFVPGVGPVMAAGLAAAAILGTGGAVGGIKAGERVDEAATEGLPADEIFFYEDALRQRRSVLIVLARGDAERRSAREAMARHGAESLDAARENWWIGLRPAEEAHYQAQGRRLADDETEYRRGFEAALQRDLRGKPLEQAAPLLRERYPDAWNSECFRTGYRRGQAYAERHCGRAA